jgi:hypothetical protein
VHVPTEKSLFIKMPSTNSFHPSGTKHNRQRRRHASSEYYDEEEHDEDDNDNE